MKSVGCLGLIAFTAAAIATWPVGAQDQQLTIASAGGAWQQAQRNAWYTPFAQKMGMSLAAGMVGWLLTYFHYEADKVQSAFTLNGIALLLTIIPGVFHLAMGLLMCGYFITDKYYNEKIRERVVHEVA